MKRQTNLLFRIALVFVSWLFLHCLWIVYDGCRPFTGTADIAIVLGNTVMEDGSVSPWLQGRVEEARQLYIHGQVKKIFVSGGITPGRKPEGNAMRDYLVNGGVSNSDVIVDNYGSNTYLTAKHFVELNNISQYASAVVVTSYYHIPRSKYIIKKLGYKKIYSACSRAFFWKDWFALVRDCVGFYKYWLVY